ncbi:MAG: sigma-70 family RNA polymerase sigma factor [Planctomycetota bacterium]
MKFSTTHWSVILSAARKGSPDSSSALSKLCAEYWYPLYAYARRQNYTAADSEDLTQGFFARLIDRNDLAAVDRERGKFRTFLLHAFKRYLANEREKANARKRGGGRSLVSLDFTGGEERYRLEPAHVETPDKRFEREWALSVIEQVFNAIREEYEAAGALETFERLRDYLTASPREPSYRELAERYDVPEGALRTAVHRMRRRFQKTLRAKISETVSSKAEIDDELRDLILALQSE